VREHGSGIDEFVPVVAVEVAGALAQLPHGDDLSRVLVDVRRDPTALDVAMEGRAGVQKVVGA
jgi:hypothetical protein